jgi:hypothetical protein
MKNIKWLKFSLDLLMVIVFALLFNKMVIAGLAFHEIAGLAVGFAFILHMLLNWRWIKQVTLELFSNKIPGKTKFGYILNVLLLLVMGYVVVSGVLVSKYLFPNLRFGNEMFLKSTHISLSYFTLLLLGIHLGLHWDWVMKMCKRMFGITQNRNVFGYVAKVAVVLVLLLGVYNVYSTNYFGRLGMIVNISGSHEGAKPSKAFNGTAPSEGTRPNVENRGQGGERRVPGGKGFPSGEKGSPSGERSFGSSNVLGVLAENLGIIAIFTLLTYYLEKLFVRKRD